MATAQTQQIRLSPEQAQFIKKLLDSGKYASTDDIIQAALALFEEQQAEREANLERARQMIAEGYEQALQGKLVDGEESFRKLKERLRKKAGLE